MNKDNQKNEEGDVDNDTNDDECPPPVVSSPPAAASSANRQRSDASRISELDDRINAKARPGPRATKPGAVASAAPAGNSGNAPNSNLSNLERDVLAKSRARGAGAAAAAPGAATAASRQGSDATTNIANLDNRITSKSKAGPRATTPGAVAAVSEDSAPPAASLSRLEHDVLAKSRARGSTAPKAATPGAVSSQGPDRAGTKASGRSATTSMALRNQAIQSHMSADEVAKSRAKGDKSSAAEAATVDLAAGKMRADENRHPTRDQAPPLVPGVSNTEMENVSKTDMVEDEGDNTDGAIVGGVAGAGIATAAVAAVGNGEGGEPSQPRQPDEAATLTPLLHDSSPVEPSTEARASYFQDDVYANPDGEDYPAMDMITEEIPIDETTGGIQAYVMPTVYDASNVQIIKSDEEEEAEAKKKYIKKVMIAACCLAIVAVAIAVPVSIVAGGGREVKIIKTDPPSASPTSAPSSMPSSFPTTDSLQLSIRSLTDDSLIDTLPSEFRDAVTLFREQNVSTLEQLQDKNSPQRKALEWVANEDSMRLEYDNPKIIQRYIMALFYFAMDGDNWTKCFRDAPASKCSRDGSPWLSEDDECTWFGSKCVDGKISQFFQGTSLGNGVKGEFPKEICYFTEMTIIALHNNLIEGTIPACFGRFSKLRNIVLSNNGIELPIPDEAVQGWKSLRLLFLDENELSGPFPEKLLGLPSLQELDLNFNTLTGPIPEFNSTGTPLLFHLDLSRNTLRGNIPASLFDIPRLKTLNLSKNFAIGNIPPNIGDASKLANLDLGNNQLDGKIPDSLYNATAMSKLILSFNNFTEKITPEIFTTLPNLKSVSLDNNQFSGPVPGVLASPSQLFKFVDLLALQENDFTGNISEAICNAKNESVRLDFRIQILRLDCDKVICDPSCCQPRFECV